MGLLGDSLGDFGVHVMPKCAVDVRFFIDFVWIESYERVTGVTTAGLDVCPSNIFAFGHGEIDELTAILKNYEGCVAYDTAAEGRR